MESVLLPLLIVGLFYFILLRPVINQQREHKRDISALDIGDEVITAGGIFATVREINTTEDGPMEIILEVAPGVRLRGTTAAVDHVVRRAAEVAADRARRAGGEPGEQPGGRA
jgi:preprotein translocase subunit YajC